MLHDDQPEERHPQAEFEDNLVHSLMAIAHALKSGQGIADCPTGDGHKVGSITEGLMSVAAASVKIANAIENVTDNVTQVQHINTNMLNEMIHKGSGIAEYENAEDTVEECKTIDQLLQQIPSRYFLSTLSNEHEVNPKANKSQPKFIPIGWVCVLRDKEGYLRPRKGYGQTAVEAVYEAIHRAI